MIENSQLAQANLAWILSTQDLISPQSLNVHPHEVCEHFLKAEHDYSALAADLSKGSHFLGTYAEKLWCFYLKNSQRYRLIANNIQVHEQGKTLGEFDFILQDQINDQFIHLEFAIKFYLGLPDKNHKHAWWFGPNHIDRLDKKAQHLRAKQLTLSQLQETHKTLAAIGIKDPRSINTQSVIKGRLFKPYNTFLREALEAAQANEIHPQNVDDCTWFTLSEFTLFTKELDSPQRRYAILEKTQWLSLSIHPNALCDRAALIDQLDILVGMEGRGVMVLIDQRSEEHSKTDKEYASTKQACFVVHDNWLEQCYSSLENSEV